MKQQKNLITLHRGEVLFRQGEYGSSMFEVVQGRLDIVADEGKKTETRIAAMEQGQCFGVSGILECTPRIATAVAAEDVVVVQKISAEEFAFYFLENQEKVLQIMRHMGALLRQMDKDYARLSRAAQQNALDTVKRPSPLRGALLRLAAQWDAACDAMSRETALDMAGKIH